MGISTFVIGVSAGVVVGPLLAVIAAGTVAAFLINRMIDTDKIAKLITKALTNFENSIHEETAKLGRSVDRVNRMYQADIISFLHKLFVIPTTPNL